MKIIGNRKYKDIQNKLFDCMHENYLLKEQVKELKYSQESNEKFLQHILISNNNSLESIVKNKNQETCYIVKSEDDKILEFYLYNLKNKRISSKILTTKSVKYDLVNNVFKKQYKYIFIDDCYSIEENVGNGSLLMSYLLNYVKNKEFKYIIGYLSEVDYYNRNKQENFYKKYNFEILYTTKEKRKGKILLNLKNKI